MPGPISKPSQKTGVREYGGFVGKRYRDKGERDYSKERSSKTDRERPSPKGDKEKGRIFDTEGFKKAIEEAQKNFGKP